MTKTAWQKRQDRVRAIVEQEFAVRIPPEMVDVILRIENARRQLAKDLGRDPMPEEVAERLGISAEVVQQLMLVTGEVNKTE